MKLMYSFEGAGTYCVYLEARVNYVIPGSMILEKPPITVPLLTLEYDLESLRAVSAILGAMHLKEEEPEVYIWDEHSPEPEVAIFFRTKKPGKTVLNDITGKTAEILDETVAKLGCAQIYTIAEVNLAHDDIDTFIREYEACRAVVVDVREVGQPIDDEPLNRFVTRDLFRRKPYFGM